MTPITLDQARARATVGARLQVLSHTGRPERTGTVRTIAEILDTGAIRCTVVTPGVAHEPWVTMFLPADPARFRGIDADAFEYDTLHPQHPGTIRLRFVTGEAGPDAARVTLDTV